MADDDIDVEGEFDLKSDELGNEFYDVNELPSKSANLLPEFTSPAWMLEQGWSLDSCIDEKSKATIEKMLLEEQQYSYGRKASRCLGIKQAGPFVAESSSKTIAPPKSPWTEEEKNLFIQGMTIFGRSWSKIANLIPTRSSLQVKNYAQQYLKSLAKKTAEETSHKTTRETKEPPSSLAATIASVTTGQPTTLSIASVTTGQPTALSSSSAGAVSLHSQLAKQLFSTSKPKMFPTSSKLNATPSVTSIADPKVKKPVEKKQKSVQLASNAKPNLPLIVATKTELNVEKKVGIKQESLQYSSIVNPNLLSGATCLVGSKVTKEIGIKQKNILLNKMSENKKAKAEKSVSKSDAHLSQNAIALADMSGNPILKKNSDFIVLKAKPQVKLNESDNVTIISKQKSISTVFTSSNDGTNDSVLLPSAKTEDSDEEIDVDIEDDSNSLLSPGRSSSPSSIYQQLLRSAQIEMELKMEAQKPVEEIIDNQLKDEGGGLSEDQTEREDPSEHEKSELGTEIKSVAMEEEEESSGDGFKPDDAEGDNLINAVLSSNGEMVQFDIPEEERVMLPDEISEEEKCMNADFFDKSTAKTPERYLKIRNYILDAWTMQKPSYVTKTAVRADLRCGDVNCISRIHSYLEAVGAINFGCDQALVHRNTQKLAMSGRFKAMSKAPIKSSAFMKLVMEGEDSNEQQQPPELSTDADMKSDAVELEECSSLSGDGFKTEDVDGEAKDEEENIEESLINAVQSSSGEMVQFDIPEEERVMPPDEITEEEKSIHADYFDNSRIKTPERYLKIRNFILDSWTVQKPAYVKKTAVRTGLKNCGDVNCIGRIHSYLEAVGAINFGCEQASYRNTQKNAPLGNRSKGMSKEQKQSTSARKQQSTRPRKKRTRDENGFWVDVEGVTIEHGIEKSKPQVKKPRLPKQVKHEYNPFKLVPCLSFSNEKQEPYKIEIYNTAVCIMDIHSHISKTEVIGMLGGEFVASRQCLVISMAIPCKSMSTGMQCEMDPVSQTLASEQIESMGMSVVGWYHSHPTFNPDPSVRDIETQQKFQYWFAKGGGHFVGMIISPYNTLLSSTTSEIRCLTISEEFNPEYLCNAPYQFDYSIVYRENLREIIQPVCELAQKYHNYANRVVLSCQYKASLGITCLTKMLESVKSFLVPPLSDSDSNKACSSSSSNEESSSNVNNSSLPSSSPSKLQDVLHWLEQMFLTKFSQPPTNSDEASEQGPSNFNPSDAFELIHSFPGD